MGTIAGAHRARTKPGSLICPLDADPLSFTWPARDLSITVVGDEQREKETTRLVQALIRDGAALVVKLLAPSGASSFHKQLTTESNSVHPTL